MCKSKDRLFGIELLQQIPLRLRCCRVHDGTNIVWQNLHIRNPFTVTRDGHVSNSRQTQSGGGRMQAGLEQDQEKNGNAEEHARVNMDRTMADL
jgi:hypothetical protein